MSTYVSVICYKSKTLKNGEHPLMLRIAQNRKSKYQSLGVSVAAQYWDFEKNCPKNNCPNKDLIEKIILDIRQEYQEKILVKKATNEEFTASTLINEEKDKKINPQTVEDFYKSLIAELRIQGNIGNGEAYLNSYHSLKNFNKGKALNYTFGYIDQRFLKKYENWMRNKGLKETTLSFQFRTLRAIFNKAIEEKIVSPDKNPFPTFKISKFSIKTQKRALSKEDITKIITTESINSTPIRTLARHIFIFSYLCGGISFVDIENLKMENIQRGRLHYQRQKTHGEINLKINDIALSIIQYYKAHQIKASYLFPILDATKHKTPMQKKNRVHKVCAQVNKELRNLAKELNINAPITTYWARHSFATILKKSGVNISIISEALGHHDIQTTQIYLDSFENEQVDAAMKNLL